MKLTYLIPLYQPYNVPVDGRYQFTEPQSVDHSGLEEVSVWTSNLSSDHFTDQSQLAVER